jgi:hypothetical protein
MAKERLKKERQEKARREARAKARYLEIRGRLARTDEAVSSEEEAEGRLAQLGFDDWLD